MSTVTITRQFGAGGSEVARRLAALLGWTVIDNEFVAAVAARSGVAPETVAAHEERAPSLNERLIRALATASPEVFVPAAADGEDVAEEKLVQVTERIIAEAAQDGHAVLVGRGAQVVLSRNARADTLNVYVTAPRADRIRTSAARMAVSAAEAETLMDDTDAARDRYVDKWYGRKRQDPSGYHLVVNTGSLGYDGAAELIAAAVRQRGWA